jgi:phytoene dehydrogenase-like protein
MSKSIIIIGGGMAGLAAGCYGQMNGYSTKVFELHDLPGGLCTAWERQGYIFDGCIHYLYGSGPGQPFHRLWEELGAVQERHFLNHQDFMRVIGQDGRAFTLYSDPDRLEQHIRELSPADAGLGKMFADGIRSFLKFDMSRLVARPRALMNPLDWGKFFASMMPYLGPLLRWWPLDAAAFARRFRDPLLQQAIPLVFGWGEIPMMAALMQLAYMQNRNAGFPAGGSLEFARAVEKRYLALGGELHYKAQVEKIIVENDRAVGVRLYNDEVHRSDYVISAADAYRTINDMLDGKYTNRSIRRTYDGHLPIHSQIQVSLGVDRDLSDDPHWVTYLLDEPILIAGEERREIGVKHYCFDRSLAPEGKSVMEIMLRSNYDYWQRIYGRRLYDTEQLQVSDTVTEQLEKYYPGLKDQTEVVDVATPLSYERYTANWLGSTTGWLPTRQTMMMLLLGVSKRLPGLRNLYLAGQWVEPGGSLPLAAASGRNAIHTICHEDGRPFITTTPCSDH